MGHAGDMPSVSASKTVDRGVNHKSVGGETDYCISARVGQLSYATHCTLPAEHHMVHKGLGCSMSKLSTHYALVKML